MRKALRTLALGALVAAPLVGLSTPAHAFTNVTVAGGQLSVNSTDVGDFITITPKSDLGGILEVRNTKDTLIAAGACGQFDANTVWCPTAGVTKIQVNTQGGDDWVQNNTALPSRAFMGPGEDHFYGGSNQDFVSGNDHDDVLIGEGGNDILVGNAGSDRTWGYAGHDFCDGEDQRFCEES